jgi:hypothetical protein
LDNFKAFKFAYWVVKGFQQVFYQVQVGVLDLSRTLTHPSGSLGLRAPTLDGLIPYDYSQPILLDTEIIKDIAKCFKL